VRHRLTGLTLAVVLAVTTGRASADNPPAGPPVRYYMILFGGQADLFRPRTAHTWATYVRAVPLPDGTVRVEPFTISWLPTTLHIRPWAVRPEPGANLTLDQTLAFMAGHRQRISLWGPFEITEEYYREALRQKETLDGGTIAYRVLNPLDYRTDVSHCVHAVTRTDPALDRMTRPVLWFGELGTVPVAGALARTGLVIDPGTTHDWLLPALGLEGRPFVLRRPGNWFPILRR